MNISSTPVINQHVNFNGVKRTKRGINYHHTNAGLAVGGAMGLASAGFWYNQSKGIDAETVKLLRKYGYNEKAIQATVKQAEKLKKYALPFGAIATVASVGCGLLIDMIRNKKAQAVAEQAAIQGSQQTCMTNRDARITPFGTVYHHSAAGKKNGVLLGAACGLGHGLMMGNPLFLPSLLAFTLGGFIMGAITDKIANNKAKDLPIM